MEVVKLEHKHLVEMKERLAAHQRAVAEHLIHPAAFEMASHGHSWAFLDDGEVFAAGGVIDAWPGRGTGWAVVTDNLGARRLKFMTRKAQQILAEAPYRRVEVTVDTKFEPGVIWSLLLGFKYEGKMLKYGPDGEDHYLLAYTKDE